jgi:hypothetical protein
MRAQRAGQAARSRGRFARGRRGWPRKSPPFRTRKLCTLSSLSTGGIRLERLRNRDSFRMWPRRSSGNGGKPSQPQPRWKPGWSPSGRQVRRKRTAGRLTKPPRGGRWRACPLADAKAACFVSAHRDPGTPSGGRGNHRNPGDLRARWEPAPDQRPSGRRNGQAGHRVFGSRTGPAGSEAFGQAHCHRLGRNFGSGGVGQDRASAWELRTRCGPRASAHGYAKAEPGLRPRIQPDAISRASVHENGNGREAEREFQIRRAANRQGFGPDGEPAGKPERLRPGRTP